MLDQRFSILNRATRLRKDVRHLLKKLPSGAPHIIQKNKALIPSPLPSDLKPHSLAFPARLTFPQIHLCVLTSSPGSSIYPAYYASLPTLPLLPQRFPEAPFPMEAHPSPPQIQSVLNLSEVTGPIH